MATLEITTEYRAKAGSHISNTAARIIGPELQRLASGKEEPLEPREVVASAKRKRSPLHPFFEWDDHVAADAWRISQARHMLACVEVKVITKNGETTEQFVRAFHNVTLTRTIGEEPAPSERGYVTLETAFTEEDYAEQIIDDAERELKAWSARYAQYRNLAKFGQRLGEVVDAVERLDRVAA